MQAWTATGADRERPLDHLTLVDADDEAPVAGWVRVTPRAVSLNHHDLWSLRGVGLRAEQLPMTLGTDAAGVTDDGREVIVHAVIASPEWLGDETFDPRRTLLSEKYPGALAEAVWVPASNLIDKPAELGFEAASCLPTAWLTAYKMLFVNAGVTPGDTVLVQGAGGGVATALIQLGSAAGLRVWVTSRSPERAERALTLGADQAFASGERLPERVDAVLETVGAATWSHSVTSLRPGGTMVICGATSGFNPDCGELQRIFFQQLRVIGSTMGNRQQLQQLTSFVSRTGIEPLIDSTHAFDAGAEAFTRLASGEAFGKVVVTR